MAVPQPPIKSRLESDFFTKLPPAVLARLQSALDSDGRNFRPGKREPSTVDGQAVAAIQEALNTLRDNGHTEISEVKDPPGNYADSTKTAVKSYKGSHGVQRAGQALDDIVGRMTMTQLDDDLMDLSGKKKEPEPPAVRTQDILIELLGFHEVEEQGAREPTRELDVANTFNTDAYLKRHQYLEVMTYKGGEHLGSPLAKIMARMQPLIDRGSIGRVFVHGGSGGGRNVLEVVRALRRKKVDITLVAVWDGAFQRSDLAFPGQGENILTGATLFFRGIGEKMNAGAVLHNYFQSWSHTLDSGQEIHGKIEGFSSQPDLTNSLAILAIRTAYERKLSNRGANRQEAMDAAHTAAYEFGKADSSAKVASFLRT